MRLLANASPDSAVLIWSQHHVGASSSYLPISMSLQHLQRLFGIWRIGYLQIGTDLPLSDWIEAARKIQGA